MNTQRSSVALRSIIVAAVTGVPGDSLDEINSAQLPDGAEVFVVSQGSVFRLDKTSTVTPNAAVIEPAGGPGRFIYQSGTSGGDSFQFTGTANLTGTSAATDDTWLALPSGANFYAQLAQSGFWTVSTTTGIATYAGPTARVKVTGVLTISSAVAAQAVEAAITVNQTLVGTTTADYVAASANVPPTTPGLAVQLMAQRFYSLSEGDTVSLAFRTTSGSNNLTVSRVSLIAE